jgi:hypothetical protein
MSSLVFVVGMCLVLAALVAVVQPLLHGVRSGADDVEASDLRALRESRDRALAALRELEFDRRAGAISEADYRAVIGALRREAAVAVARTKDPR